jgi:hypothetical protein
MATTYQTMPAAWALDLLAGLFDARVTVDDRFPPEDCLVCNEVGARTSARVYGDPFPDASQPAVVDCCAHCLPVVVNRAHRELRDASRVGVRIEVATWVR